MAGIPDSGFVGGLGIAGLPTTLIDALIERGARDLTIVSNNAGNGTRSAAMVIGFDAAIVALGVNELERRQTISGISA